MDYSLFRDTTEHLGYRNSSLNEHLDLVQSTMAPSSERAYLVSKVVENWMEVDPQQAKNYLNNMPKQAYRNYAMGRVLEKWHKIEPELVLNYLNRMPKEASRQRKSLLRRLKLTEADLQQ